VGGGRAVLLIRHARAGERAEWRGDDRLRPLDGRGHEQALALVGALSEFPIERIVSSPALRCVQTVEPLATARGLVVEPLDELGEELQSVAGAAVVRELAGEAVAVCGHGGLESALGIDERWRKGATFVLDADLAVLRRIRPPA
jgi:phosphohistidine phosphatase SixA